jgi:hypothetical protein
MKKFHVPANRSSRKPSDFCFVAVVFASFSADGPVAVKRVLKLLYVFKPCSVVASIRLLLFIVVAFFIVLSSLWLGAMAASRQSLIEFDGADLVTSRDYTAFANAFGTSPPLLLAQNSHR